MNCKYFILSVFLILFFSCPDKEDKFSELFDEEKRFIGKTCIVIPPSVILANVNDIGMTLNEIQNFKKIDEHKKVKIRQVFNLKTKLPYKNDKFWFQIELPDKSTGFIPDCMTAESVYVALNDNSFLNNNQNKNYILNDTLIKGDLVYIIDSSDTKLFKIKVNSIYTGFLKKKSINKRAFSKNIDMANEAYFLNSARLANEVKYYYKAVKYYNHALNCNINESFIKNIAESELQKILKNDFCFNESKDLDKSDKLAYYRKFDALYEACYYKGHIYDYLFFKNNDDTFTVINSTKDEFEGELRYYVYADKIDYYGNSYHHAYIDDLVSIFDISITEDNGFVILGQDKFENYFFEDTDLFFNYRLKFILKEITGNIKPASPVQCENRKYAIIDNYEVLKLIKINREGREEWLKEYPYVKGKEGYRLLNNENGDFFIFACLDKNCVNTDISLIKCDAGGNFLWEKIIPDMKDAEIIKQKDGILLLCSFDAENKNEDKKTDKNQSTDISLLKLDFDGNVSWNKIIFTGFNEDNISLDFTNDEGYIVSGNIIKIEGNALNQGKKTALGLHLFKLDKNGDKTWDRLYRTQSNNEISSRIIQMKDDSYILFGYAPIDMHLCKQFIYKLNSEGKPVK